MADSDTAATESLSKLNLMNKPTDNPPIASTPWPLPVEGGCACRALRYRLDSAPKFNHCCNCHSCQRETGSAFCLNLLVEADQVTLIPSIKLGTEGIVKPKYVLTSSESGAGQLIVRCPHCYVAVWSHYDGAGPYSAFIRGGTLDKQSIDGRSIEEVLKPDIFIFTESKQPWVVYPQYAHDHDLIKEVYYDRKKQWSKEANERLEAMKPKMLAWQLKGEGRWKAAFPDLEDVR